MVNRSKQKGTAYETEIVQYLRGRGWVHAERRTLSGAHDRGDISGVVGVVIECKNAKTHDLPGWLNELETETANADADVGLLFVRRRGTTDRGRDYAVMTVDQASALLARLEGWTIQDDQEGTPCP